MAHHGAVDTPLQDAEPKSAARASAPSAAVETLRRWEESGAIWRVVASTTSCLTISLLTCDGGEEVDRLVSGDPELAAYVGNRSGSDESSG